MPSLVTRDSDIRSVLIRRLREIYNDPSHDLILQEFKCNTARVDVAVVNGSMHGFEIKSDSDTLSRLKQQIQQYDSVFDFITLVCGQRLFSAARASVPSWWGLKVARCDDGVITIKEVRKPKPNPNQKAVALAQMLWKNEALRCLKNNGHRVFTSRHSAQEIWAAAASLLDTKTLANEARLAIKARGGSGFVKRSIQDGDSCTIESIAPEHHCSANLAWLLSQRFPHPLD